MDEAGAPTRTFSVVKENQDVLIMGASGKVGLLCAYAAKDKLNGTGRLVGIVKAEENKKQIEKYGIFDEILDIDATDIKRFYEHGRQCNITEQYDIVVNCINSPNTEMASLMAVKNKGVLYFATLSCDYKLTSLTAESIGKEVFIIPYTGYIEDHATYTLDLIRRFQDLRDFLQFKKVNESVRRRTEEYETVQNKQVEFGNIGGYIFTSKESKATLRQALKVARFNSNVIIYGESGVGKEIIARIIHQNSERKSFPLIKINCAAIPENLLESELFGYEKGSFTGANSKGKIGLWEAAQNGTLFLDEVGELPISFQAKLLRVIQEKEIVRVGGISPIKVDVRIVTATNKNLMEMIQNRLFREDLYYRLNVFPVAVLPLRERKADIIPLANYFAEKYNREFSMQKTISAQALNFLSNQPFRGNIRELQNLIQRLMITTDYQVVEVKDILYAMAYDQKQNSAADAVQAPVSVPGEWMVINRDETSSLKTLLDKTEESILREYKKKYKSTRKIAEALKISQPSVVKKLNQYGINDSNP
jgi:TyrR family helix-turn-helix protein